MRCIAEIRNKFKNRKRALQYGHLPAAVFEGNKDAWTAGLQCWKTCSTSLGGNKAGWTTEYFAQNMQHINWGEGGGGGTTGHFVQNM